MVPFSLMTRRRLGGVSSMVMASLRIAKTPDSVTFVNLGPIEGVLAAAPCRLRCALPFSDPIG
jgi:hypothetical protein